MPSQREITPQILYSKLCTTTTSLLKHLRSNFYIYIHRFLYTYINRCRVGRFKTKSMYVHPTALLDFIRDLSYLLKK